jgi:hypothetical protein
MLKQNDELIRLSDAGIVRGGRWLVRGVDLAVIRRHRYKTR